MTGVLHLIADDLDLLADDGPLADLVDEGATTLTGNHAAFDAWLADRGRL